MSMRNIKIRIKGNSSFKSRVTIDGNPVKLKKNEFGTYETVYSTDKDTINLAVTNYLELAHPLWLLMSLAFFIISVFGIFDTRYDRRCRVVDCNFNVKLTGKDEIILKYPANNKDGDAISIEYDGEVEEISNSIYVDKKVKSRYKIFTTIRIVVWIAIIIIGGLLIVNKVKKG